MSSVFKIYNKLLLKHPVLVQAVQTGLLMGTGDLICQKLIEERKVIEWKRTAQFASVGFFFAGPVLRQWYGILNTRITVGSKFTLGLKRVSCDQFVFAPALLAVLLTMFNGLQGMPLKENKEKLKKDYPDVLKNNYLLWPWVQMINFTIVPLNYQVLLVQFVCLFWNAYLSWKAHANVKLL